MTLFYKLFGKRKPVIGMIHLKPLPGAPGYDGDLEHVYTCALKDLKALEAGGATAFMIENFGDIPYDCKNDLITLTAFTNITSRLRQKSRMPMGINVQFNDFRAEWAIAYSTDADFIRIEVFAENRIGPNGVFAACGPELMRLKQRYPKDIALLCDLQVKHTVALREQSLDFTIESIIEGGGDAIIETGMVTGKKPTIEDVKRTKQIAGAFPVIVGSGVHAAVAKEYFDICDGAIIGSDFKYGGNVRNHIDEDRVKNFINTINQ